MNRCARTRLKSFWSTGIENTGIDLTIAYRREGPSPSRVYCIFAQLTNGNVLGKLPIRDSNNREIENCYWWIW